MMFSNIKVGLAVLVCWLATVPANATAATPDIAQQSNVDHVWIVVAAALVFFMQAGFLLLEAGSVRSKNSVNVAQKNLMDFIASTVVFGVFGFTLMFGTSQWGWFGWQPDLLFFGAADDWSMTFFVFQLMFCGTAATIMSGAVAERMSMNGYLLGALLIAAVVYPVAGHWAWGGLLNGSEEPFLASMGFMDFAGSTVVHSVGAWVALAAIIVIGPRIGKFDENGKPRTLHGHSPVLATVGAIILWVGWIGFNGGSTLSGTSGFSLIIMNTMIAGGAGGLTLMIIGRFAAGVFKPDATINGLLGGLVAITAGPDVMTPQTSFLVGALGGGVVFASTYLLEHILKLDDPLGAIPVHGFAGAFGTIAVALFAPADTLLAGSRMAQFTTQLTGVALVFAWSFGVTYAVMKTVDTLLKGLPDGGNGLRVPEHHEREGLNQHEHDAPMGTGILQEVMAEVARDHGGALRQIELDYGDEAYETSVLFNRIIQNISNDRDAEAQANAEMLRNREAIEAEIAKVVRACAEGDFSMRLTTEGREDFLLELCNGINTLCEGTETAMRSVQNSLNAVASGDLSQRIEGAYKGQLHDIQSAMNSTLEQLSDVVEDVQASVNAASKGDFSCLVSLDQKKGFFRGLSEGVNALCEISEKGLSELLKTLNQVGDGDLTVSMSDDYQGRFAEISRAVSRMTNGVSDLLGSIEETARAVSARGQDISRTSDQVSSVSSDQSRRIDATANTLRDMAEGAKAVASEAYVADENTKRAFDRAEEGGHLAQELSGQIAEIQDASNQITEALEQIESISMQTNLLSLNASVEAVRSQGKNGGTEGFKVVAQEIRDLANRSADAAADIRGRTERVAIAVNRGAELVGKTSDVLMEINEAMTHSSSAAARLAETGNGQVSRAESIALDVSDISKQAAENLKLAANSASVSCELEKSASETLEKITRFKRNPSQAKRAA